MAKTKKKKIYAVRAGRKTGLFDTWSECKKQVDGYGGAQFKSFETRREAEAYLGISHSEYERGGQNTDASTSDSWADRVHADQEAGILVAFTDGSYEHKLKKYAYGAVLVTPEGEKHTLRGSGNDPRYVESRNIPGEAMGVLYALDWARDNGYERVKIYHDYIGLAAWAKGEWKTNTNVSIMYKTEFNNKAKGLQVEFVKVPAHSDVELNEYADKLAKFALGEPMCECTEGSSLEEANESTS